MSGYCQQNITNAMNTYTIPLLTYLFVIINWTKADSGIASLVLGEGSDLEERVL